MQKAVYICASTTIVLPGTITRLHASHFKDLKIFGPNTSPTQKLMMTKVAHQSGQH